MRSRVTCVGSLQYGQFSISIASTGDPQPVQLDNASVGGHEWPLAQIFSLHGGDCFLGGKVTSVGAAWAESLGTLFNCGFSVIFASVTVNYHYTIFG